MSSKRSKCRFLDEARSIIRFHKLSYATDKNYVGWIRRFILWSGKRHPRDMGITEVQEFLSKLVTKQKMDRAFMSTINHPTKPWCAVRLADGYLYSSNRASVLF